MLIESGSVDIFVLRIGGLVIPFARTVQSRFRGGIFEASKAFYPVGKGTAAGVPI